MERGFLRQLRGDIYVKGISERHGKVSHTSNIYETYKLTNDETAATFDEMMIKTGHRKLD